MVVLPHDRGRLFYAIVTKMRYWDMQSIIFVLFIANISCKSSRPDIIFAMICYLVAALLLPNVGALKLRISLDILNSTCDLGVIHDLIMWI